MWMVHIPYIRFCSKAIMDCLIWLMKIQIICANSYKKDDSDSDGLLVKFSLWYSTISDVVLFIVLKEVWFSFWNISKNFADFLKIRQTKKEINPLLVQCFLYCIRKSYIKKFILPCIGSTYILKNYLQPLSIKKVFWSCQKVCSPGLELTGPEVCKS